MIRWENYSLLHEINNPKSRISIFTYDSKVDLYKSVVYEDEIIKVTKLDIRRQSWINRNMKAIIRVNLNLPLSKELVGINGI